MSLLDLKPSRLDIDAVSGDDVKVSITLLESCDSSTPVNLSGMVFDASFTVGNTSYSANVTSANETGQITVVWSDQQTTLAGNGSHPWRLRVTEGDITRTRVNGTIRLVVL